MLEKKPENTKKIKLKFMVKRKESILLTAKHI